MYQQLQNQMPAPPWRVLLLQGGWSQEKTISAQSGQGVFVALKRLNHQVSVYDPTEDLVALTEGVKNSFDGHGPDVVFNMLHGMGGEDGTVQTVLDFLKLPYTFSGRIASAAAMHKGLSRDVAAAAGVPIAPGRVLSVPQYKNQSNITFPHVIKPLTEGSSVGLFYIPDATARLQAMESWHFGPQILMEEFFPGRELQVGVMGGKALGLMEVVFPGPVFDYEAKYTAGVTQHILSPSVPANIQQKVLRYAEVMHSALGCRGVTRAEFRYNPQAPQGKELAFLELNTQPGMSKLSLIPDIAHQAGHSYDAVVSFLLKDAWSAWQQPRA